MLLLAPLQLTSELRKIAPDPAVLARLNDLSPVRLELLTTLAQGAIDADGRGDTAAAAEFRRVLLQEYLLDGDAVGDVDVDVTPPTAVPAVG